MSHFAWLKSIRVGIGGGTSGNLSDDDCNRIEEYFQNQIKKTINKCWEDVNTPKEKHYSQGAIQPMKYIAANNLSFFEGNIIKYVTRYKHKGTPVEDLTKAKVYLEELIKANQ